MNQTMLAARWYGRRDIRVEQIPRPRAAPGQVLVAVERVGLSGSELEEYRDGPVGIPPAAVPIVLGHEVVGVVAACPGGELVPGTRVVPDVIVGCGRCWWCRRHEEGLCPNLRVRGQQQDGGLAEYMLAAAATCLPVPAGLDPDAVGFAEPAAVAVRAVRAVRKAGDVAGSVVCVYGAGTIGQLIAQVALAAPTAAVVAVDPVASRRELAAAAGALACAPEHALALLAEVSHGRGADAIFECAGTPQAPAAAVALSRRGGQVVLVGFRPGELRVDWLDVVLGERRLAGTVAHLWDVDVAAGLALLARGVLDPGPLHTAIVPLADTPAAFARLDADRGVLKLLIAPTLHPKRS